MSAPRISPPTIQAQRKLFALLEERFDGDKGAYQPGWGDAKVAKETGLSEAAVKEYRTAAFGALQPPSDLVTLRQELEEAEGLFIAFEQTFKEKIADIRRRLGDMERRFK